MHEKETIDAVSKVAALFPGAVTENFEKRLADATAAEPVFVSLVWKYTEITNVLLAFVAERLKVNLRDRNIPHDIIDAALSRGRSAVHPSDPQFLWGDEDIVSVVARVEALQAFLKTDDGANLLIGYRRAANILKIEEKKDEKQHRGTIVAPLFVDQEEFVLLNALNSLFTIQAAAREEDFATALTALATLRVPVDRFFDKVKVNADEPAVRENRLRILSKIVEAAHQVADFSKVEG